VIARLEELPGQGTLQQGTKLFAERDRFGKWQHVLGPKNALVAFTVDSSNHERLGVTDRIYTAETARRRRALAKKLGISVADGETEPLDVALDDLLAVPRSGWAAYAGRADTGPPKVGRRRDPASALPQR